MGDRVADYCTSRRSDDRLALLGGGGLAVEGGDLPQRLADRLPGAVLANATHHLCGERQTAYRLAVAGESGRTLVNLRANGHAILADHAVEVAIRPENIRAYAAGGARTAGDFSAECASC